PVMLRLAREAAVEVAAKYDKIISWCSLDASLAEKIDFFAREKAPFEALINCEDWDKAYNILQTASFERLTMPKIEDKELAEKIKAVRNDAKKAAKNIQISYISGDTKSIKEEIYIIAPAIKCMCDVTIKVAQEFAQLKKQKNIIDFSDFEHMCLQILNDNGAQSAAAVEIMNRYDEIYIDEYQDCNSVQEAIFRLISGANKGCPNVFAVGDMKQSIYKFRDANPKLFKYKSDTYPSYDSNHYQPYSKILLNTNFRSRSQIIDCVNSVFRQLMTEEAGEMDYTEDEYLYCGSESYTQINRDQLSTDVVLVRGDEREEIAVQLTDESDSEEEQIADEVVEYTKEAAEAAYIAKRINEIVSDPDYTVYDKQIDGFRHVEYRDIVILMRGIRANAGAFSSVFKQCGIPLFVDVNGYFDAPEIDFLINFLKIIDNPLDDIPLVAIMHHPLFGFTDNELLTIRASVKKCAFYKAVKQYCGGDGEKYLAEKCKHFVQLIVELWDRSKYLSVNQLLEYAINKTNYMVYLSTLNNSAVANSNVRMLFTKAKEFETNNFKGIFNFVNYIDKIRSKGKDSDSAKLIGENDNVVRVMTIHKSKGLEFPIVFLARTTTKFNKRDLNSNILMHKDYGVGVNVIDYSRR
ncbi:MAG: UvrD-helicase domain-containing protein, partial [Clostridia bacterium]|nr:UvrD-helicase domain-containing protein [Clostridia bacterium]